MADDASFLEDLERAAAAAEAAWDEYAITVDSRDPDVRRRACDAYENAKAGMIRAASAFYRKADQSARIKRAGVVREAVKSAAVRYESAAAELRVAKAAVHGKGGPEDVMRQCVRVLAKAAADLAKNGSVHVVSRGDLAQIRGIYGFDGQRDQWPADKIIAFVDALETWPGFDRAEYAAARGEYLAAFEVVRTLEPAFNAANREAERAKEALVRLWREEERIRL